MSIHNHLGKTTFVPYTSKYGNSRMYPHIYREDSVLRTNEPVEILGPTGFSIRTGKFYPKNEPVETLWDSFRTGKFSPKNVYNQYIYYTDKDKKHKHTILFELDDKFKLFLLNY